MLPDTLLIEAARRALAALEDLIADSRDPGVEALGARYELAHALGQVAPNELPLDEEGFASQRMEAANFRKLFHSARDRADNLAERVAELQDKLVDTEAHVREQVARDIETHDGKAPWGAFEGPVVLGAWIDSRDARQAARIARREAGQ